jgi:hypothetical protein
MSPKDKAQQLIYAFEAFTDRENELEFAKECALICVDEIRDNLPLISEIQEYWNEVKNEIIKL